MINAQFDLQNIINEMKTVDRASDSSSKSDSEEFSATLDRVSSSEASKQRSASTEPHLEETARRTTKKDISDQGDEADSDELAEGFEDNSARGAVLQASENISGKILPLLPPDRPSMNQVMLESKRPILIGDLKPSVSINDHIQSLTDSEGMQQGAKIALENGSDMARAHPKLQDSQDTEIFSLRGMSSKASKLMNAEKPDADSKDNSPVNSIHRSVEARNTDVSLGAKSTLQTASGLFDTEAFKEGLSKIIKNQIVSSFSGKNITIKMVLTPESLGEIEVDMHFTKDKSLQITLRPETAEVAKLIQTNAASLREQLSQEHRELLSLNMTGYFGGEGSANGSDSNRPGNEDNGALVGLEKNNITEPDSGELNRANKNETSSLVDTFV
ncbi:MAG TPA: hypothetical protein DEF79_12070 [Gammaproteobacteria bacterium]|nr:hypothetical protein [Gammaproteobacteria bacterium]|tara:strand:- start:2015 stop:3175 length:1161 start_codon:yes stop_codon:yes gene_type:complete